MQNMSLIFKVKDIESLFNTSDYTTFIPDPNAAPCTEYWHLNSYLVVTAYCLAFFLNLVGNSIVVLVICQSHLNWSSTDVYLLHLAIADLLFAITLPFLAVYMAHEWVFGAFMCKAISMLQEVNFYSGILLLACISIDRYLAIVHATDSIMKKRGLLKFNCFGVWIVSILLSLPILTFRTAFNTPRHGIVCYENFGALRTDRWRIIIRIVRHVFGFFLPLLIMLFCYSSIVRVLCQNRNNRKTRAMKVIMAVVVAFFICWLPYNITIFVDTLLRSNIVYDTCNRRSIIQNALSVTETLGYVHSCINPFLYAFIGQKFRTSLLRILSNHSIVSRDFLSKYGHSTSNVSPSGNNSTTL